MATPIKPEIKALLEKRDYDGVVELSRRKRNIFRHIAAMTYDKSDVLSWRAMEAIGAITAVLPPDEGRDVIQKVLWMLREESGNNAWSAPEILGEILRANPKPYLDIVPILISFHDEEFFRPGVLWAMYRIAQRWPELIEPSSAIAHTYADSSDPLVRGYAALVLKVLGKPLPSGSLEEDDSEITLYEEGALVRRPIRDLPAMAEEPVS
jgi:hypothetical protein